MKEKIKELYEWAEENYHGDTLRKINSAIEELESKVGNF